jgi:hypothetical protein
VRKRRLELVKRRLANSRGGVANDARDSPPHGIGGVASGLRGGGSRIKAPTSISAFILAAAASSGQRRMLRYLKVFLKLETWRQLARE